MFNKVIYKGTEILDVSKDTVIAEALHAGYTAHNSNGVPITGVAKTYEEGYAAGQAAGGGGASDPAAEAVMALVRMSTRTQVVNNNDSYMPMGVFYCQDVHNTPSYPFVIIPEVVTSIAGENFSSNLVNYDGYNEQIILSLPCIPPTTDRFMGWVPDAGNTPPKVIYVPDGSVDAYKAAENWSEFAHLIKPMSELMNKGNDTESLAPGLYETNTTTMIESWDDLVARGAIVYDPYTGIRQNDEIQAGDLVLPNDVTRICEGGFSYSEITGITIPDSVTSIGDYAFEDCANLTNVVYAGTTSQMTAVEKGEMVFNNTPVVNITCSNGNMDVNGWTT